TEGLHYIHPNTYELDMNRPEWREIVGDVVAAVQRGDLYYIKSPEMANFSNDPFLQGKAAMALHSQTLIEMIDNDYRLQDEDDKIKWGVVTVPVNPKRPTSNDYIINTIFAINEKTAHPEEAFALLKYINSRETGIQNNWKNGLSVYTDLSSRKDGINTEALYLLDHDVNPRTMDSVPYPIRNAVIDVATEQIDQVIQGTITLDEAMEAIQYKGQLAIDEARQ